jgi:formylglycine-generating enzyme
VASTLALGVSACAQIAGLSGDYTEGTPGAAGSKSSGGTAGAGGLPAHAGENGVSGAPDMGGDAGESNGGENGASGAPGGDAGESSGGSGASSGVGGSGIGGGVGGSLAGSHSAGSANGGSANGGSANGGTGPTAECGNGVAEAGEGCDDANKLTGDGCNAACALEAGFACSGAPSACNRSCNGLAKTCGPTANGDCCASNAVLGIGSATFFRSYDGQTAAYTSKTYPAQVSSFRLDKYEITVGRFRKFLAAYSPTMIPNGAGKNPNNPADTGWDAANWNASLDGDAAQLKAALALCAPYSSWTDVAGTASSESRPLDCLNWFEAQAFCIWDGGRLPTETEWNYAAAGGTEQRVYPWGPTAPGPDANLANYKCYYGSASGTCSGVSNIAPVGSIPAGNGKWGQSDLAGGVYEWTQDWFGVYPATCNNCAVLASGTVRVIRGGGFLDAAAAQLVSARANNGPSIHNNFFDIGARCARTSL